MEAIREKVGKFQEALGELSGDSAKKENLLRLYRKSVMETEQLYMLLEFITKEYDIDETSFRNMSDCVQAIWANQILNASKTE